MNFYFWPPRSSSFSSLRRRRQNSLTLKTVSNEKRPEVKTEVKTEDARRQMLISDIVLGEPVTKAIRSIMRAKLSCRLDSNAIFISAYRKFFAHQRAQTSDSNDHLKFRTNDQKIIFHEQVVLKKLSFPSFSCLFIFNLFEPTSSHCYKTFFGGNLDFPLS